MVPEKYQEFYATLKDLAEKGEVPMARIDDAVLRILRVKFAMGLMDAGPLAAGRPLAAARASARAAHREVARRAVRQSLVLLKNDKKALPLAKTAKRILVAGKNADDIGNQCGGWTITGRARAAPITTGGTTILAALQGRGQGRRGDLLRGRLRAPRARTWAWSWWARRRTPSSWATATTSSLGQGGPGRDREREEGGHPGGGGRRLRAAADPRRGAHRRRTRSWRPGCPGTEGQGVADVLFGDYKPTGKLSFTWPRSMAQIPINVGDATYDPLFPYGFGLTY